MNCLCIYVTYNKENKIYEYIGNVLQSLRLCCSKIYLVCNYEKIKSGLEYVQPYVDRIINRENKGYDFGAYKDVLCTGIGWDEVYKYDELVLANDSFFGFFYPLQNTFELMGKADCDFWGMTGQTAGEFANLEYQFDAHIHSYFLAFKKNVIESMAFKEFWERVKYPQSFNEAIINFEIGLNAQLKQSGFQGLSFIDVHHINLRKNENPCYSMLYELVRNYRFPIMKKKCVLIRNMGFADTLKTLAYLEKGKSYPIIQIMPFLENQFYIPEMGKEPCNSLEKFYKSYTDIYIYGAGICGKNLAIYFAYKGWDYKSFIITEPQEGHADAICIEEAEIKPDTGIIISVLSAEVAKEITKHIGKRCREEQLFYISECSAIKLPV